MVQNPKGSGLSKARLKRIGDHLTRTYVEPGRIVGCQVAVARHGRLAYRKSLGLMDRERANQMAEDAIFRIYSMTKPVTSVALMMLLERGLFVLDEPVGRVVPEFHDLRVWTAGEGEAMQTEPLKRPVSFRDLLRHTGGLTYGTLLESVGVAGARHPVDQVYKDLGIGGAKPGTLDDLVAALGRAPLRYQPGERWMYSLSTDVCGALVQRLSGKPLDVFLADEILAPLGMRDTGFFVPAEKQDRFAANYQHRADGPPVLADDPKASPFLAPPSLLSGGGGLVSTLSDYLRFGEMLRRGGSLEGTRIIGPRTLSLMRRNHLPGGGDLTQLAIGLFSETTNAGVGFGLGFALTLDQVAAGTLSRRDYHWGGAASTVFWVDPDEDLVVVFLAQLMPSSTYPIRAELRNLVYAAIED